MTVSKPLSKESLIELLELQPHPEGGYFKEVFRSNGRIAASALPSVYPNSRSYSTSIYFLLGANDFSSFHRLKSEETWYFHSGGALEILIINEEGYIERGIIGGDIGQGELFQYTVADKVWFAARVIRGDYVLVGANVSPGFEFEDFELGNADEMVKQFPDHAGLIRQLCRK